MTLQFPQFMPLRVMRYKLCLENIPHRCMAPQNVKALTEM